MSSNSISISNNTMLSDDATIGDDYQNTEDGLLFVVITLSAIAACFICILVSFLLRRFFGIQGCLSFHDDATWEQVRQNRLMALRQQQYGISTTTEDGDGGPEWERMMEKRKERREWYQEFLKPFSMVAKETDFEISSDLNDSSGMNGMTATLMTTTEDVDEEMPSYLPSSSSSSSQLGLHDSHHHSNQCCLKLRKIAPEGNQDQSALVAASCAICLGEYEVGDSIIWASQPQCRHAFHEDCILTWLSKGKKRCPICRDWFVPKAYLDDLKKQQLSQQPMLPSVQSGMEKDIEEVDEEEQRGTVNNHADDRIDDGIHNEQVGDLANADAE